MTNTISPGGQFSIGSTTGAVGSLSSSVLWVGPDKPTGDDFILWINTDDSRLYGYWNDGFTSQWVDLSIPFGAGIQGAALQASLDNLNALVAQATADANSSITNATNAATSETNAATSETNAATSETNAAASASAAATSEANATTSETNAAASAAAAATSETNAANAETGAVNAFDSLDDRYLGSKASDPTLDNDGDPLLEGALYWNSTNKQFMVYNGSAWEVAPAAAFTDAQLLASLITVDGTGSGLDADLLDGQEGAYYLPAGSYTAADVLSKLLTVDGATSGLDADLLDGQEGSYYQNASNLNAGTVPEARLALATTVTKGIVEKSSSSENISGTSTDVYPDVAGVKEMIGVHTNLPDPSYESESGTLSVSTTYTFTHGLGTLPKHVTFSYVCVTAERGWAVGDELPFTLGTENYNANVGPSVAVNATKIKVRIGSNSNARVHGFDGSSRAYLVPGNWKIKVRAWK
jgi:hypothetical protein